jgi:hypothetical protein
MKKLLIINLALACIIQSAYAMIGDTEAQFLARPGKVTERRMREGDEGEPPTLAITKLVGGLFVTNYFDSSDKNSKSDGETYRKPSNKPFTMAEIKNLAKAYAPLEKWDFFGTTRHCADLMLKDDKTGREWIRIEKSEGDPGHPYIVNFRLAHGSPTIKADGSPIN